VGGNGSSVANATSSGGTSSTSSGLTATATATGDGNMVQTASLVFSIRCFGYGAQCRFGILNSFLKA
jgi:hypothetical protein